MATFKVKIQVGPGLYYLVATSGGTGFSWTKNSGSASVFNGGSNDEEVKNWVTGTSTYLGVSGSNVVQGSSSDDTWQDHTNNSPVQYDTGANTKYLNKDSGDLAILTTTSVNVTREY